MNIHIDKFENPNCRAGGEHQWFGDGITYFSDGTSMNTRKFNLLSRKMQEEYNVVGGECTCNKCGIEYTSAFNTHFM
jgi:hypothetical protein